MSELKRDGNRRCPRPNWNGMRTLCLLVVASLSSGVLAAGAGELVWPHRGQQGAVTLNASPLRAIQRQAFYMARGFTEEQIAPYAASCAFSLGFLNNSTQVLSTELRHWYAENSAGQKVRLRLPEVWDAEWTRLKLAEPQRIAFRWAQFQSENTFEPGDWIMGMITLETPMTGPFRLVAAYRLGSEAMEITVDELRCDVAK